MIKLRFIPFNEESKNILVAIGKKQYLDLRLKPTKSWKKVLEHLCEKWNDVSELSKRLSLHPYVDDVSKSSVGANATKNLLEDLDSSVGSTLQSIPNYNLSNLSDDAKIIPVGYLIRDLRLVEPIGKPIICEDSLMKAINDWNDQSIDHYLKREKDQQAYKTGGAMPQPVHPTSQSSALNMPLRSTIPETAESGYTHLGNLDNIMHSSNTMNGLIQELLEPTNQMAPSSSSIKNQNTSEIPSTGTLKPPSPPPTLPTKKASNEPVQSSKKKSNSKSKTKSSQNSVRNGKTNSTTVNEKDKRESTIALPKELPKGEFTALITAIEMEENMTSFTKFVPPTTNLLDSHLLPAADHSLIMNSLSTPAITTANPPPAGFTELVNDYSKSNASHSNRNFAHIFNELSNKDRQKNSHSNHPEDKATQLLQALATSNSLYQSIMNQGQIGLESSTKPSSSSGKEGPLNPSKSKSNEKPVTPQPHSRKANNSSLSVNFAVSSPSTVVTPISDAEASNVHPPPAVTNINLHPSTPIKLLKASSSQSEAPNTSTAPDLSYTSPQSHPISSSGPNPTHTTTTNTVNKTPLSTKKRKFNGLQQKREVFLNSTLESNLLVPTPTTNNNPDPTANLFSPMKVPRTNQTPAPTPSKSYTTTKTQVVIEQHVLTANIMSGVCHFPSGIAPPTKQIPPFIQRLSRVGRSRPDLRRITPTYIGPLSSQTSQNVVMK